jgi:hypothetical protein
MSLRQSGVEMTYEYQDQNRNGDRICYISDLSRMKADYPSWEIAREDNGVVTDEVRSIHRSQAFVFVPNRKRYFGFEQNVLQGKFQRRFEIFCEQLLPSRSSPDPRNHGTGICTEGFKGLGTNC